MEEKKQYKIGKQKLVIADFTVKKYRKLFRFVARHNLKKFYRIEGDKFKIEGADLVKHLAMSNLLEKFLELILEPVNNSKWFKLKCFVKKLFGKSIYENIEDAVLLEVVAVFFSGKLQLLKPLMEEFLKFSNNINLPLNQLEHFQV